jgi:hypothetical protein
MDGLELDVSHGVTARQLAEMLMKQGRHEEAKQLRRSGLNPDGSITRG